MMKDVIKISFFKPIITIPAGLLPLVIDSALSEVEFSEQV